MAYWRTDVRVHAGHKDDNHGTSAKKYKILLEILSLGYHVLLSDVDVVTLQDPFRYLHRDADVEGLSDGEAPRQAQGETIVVDDPKMGWLRYAYTTRIWAMNSGLFYIRATPAAARFLQQLHARLSREKVWDQAAFNEELLFPAYHGSGVRHASPGCTIRVMDLEKFMNSKFLFKHYRNGRHKDVRPVMVHVNYHPDKWDRMKAVIAYYDGGNKQALRPFPVGSERRSSSS